MLPHKKIAIVETLFLAFWNLLLTTLLISKKSPDHAFSGRCAFLFLVPFSFVKRRDFGRLSAVSTRVCSWQSCEERVYLGLLWLP